MRHVSEGGRSRESASRGQEELLFGGNELLKTDTASSDLSSRAGAGVGPDGEVGSVGSEGPRRPSTDYAETIDAVELPEPVDRLAADYADVFDERDQFLWRWIYSLLPEFTLSSVEDGYAERARVQKTVLTIFVTLMDDLIEKRGDIWTFDEICRSVCWSGGTHPAHPDVDADVVSLAERIWAEFEPPLKSAPRYDQYRELFEYDFRQALNAMDYSWLVNERLSMANLAGAGHYAPHNMIMFPYADLDLMYSPTFDQDELGAVRELIWDLQKMARIGNWLTTWERELEEGDCSAGVLVYALQRGVVSVEDVQSPDPDRRAAAARRIKEHGIEDLFVQEWWRLYTSAVDHGFETESVDLDDFVAGMETVMAHHMASRGHK